MAKIILVVDDYFDTRQFMRFLLERHGHQVIEATNGVEAIEAIQKESPDLVFMDVAMPEMDGLTATRIIRDSEATAQIPIIAFTAFGKHLRQEAIEAGCNDLIIKPLEPETLDPLLDQYLDAPCPPGAQV